MDDATPLGAMPLADLLEAIAARTPAPGGGAVAAAAGGLAAALGRMTIAWTKPDEPDLDVDPDLDDPPLPVLAADLADQGRRLLALAAADAAAFAAYEAERRDRRRDPAAGPVPAEVARRIIEIPREVLDHGLAILARLEGFGPRCNPHLRSDLAVAAILAEATAAAAAWNVRVNLALLDDPAIEPIGLQADAVAEAIDDAVADAAAARGRIEAACRT